MTAQQALRPIPALLAGIAIAGGFFYWGTRHAATGPVEEPPAIAPMPVANAPAAVPASTPAFAPEAEPAILPAPAKARKPAKRAPKVFRPVANNPQPKPSAEAPAAKPVPQASSPAPIVTPEPPAVAVGSTGEAAPVVHPEINPPELNPLDAAPPAPKRTVVIKAGTLVGVRLAENVSSKSNQVGDTFLVTLDEPLVVDGLVIAERGARALGRVADVEQSGRVKGRASLTLELKSLTTSDGQTVDVTTQPFVRQAPDGVKDDAVKVGLGAAIGAVIGAAAGGGKGAAIGAASGGGAAAGGVLATRGKAAELPAETRLKFRIDRDVSVTER